MFEGSHQWGLPRVLVRRDVRGNRAFGLSQEWCIISCYSQSVSVDRFTTPQLEVSDGASEQDDAVDWAEPICERRWSSHAKTGGLDFENVLITVLLGQFFVGLPL